MLPDFTPARKGAILVSAAALAILAALVLLLAPLLAPAPEKSAEPPPAAPAEPLSQAGASPGSGAPSPRPGSLDPPRSTEMTLTVPKLEKISRVPVKTAHGSEEAPLRDGAMHVLGTGYPWQDGANTYIAGHRLGFPGTRSDRLFWDLDKLENGDEVVLTDADDRRYAYKVFRTRVVGPTDVSVAKPLPDKDVVSLQTCTLPDYSKRLVVQAELVSGPSTKTDAGGDAGDAFGLGG